MVGYNYKSIKHNAVMLNNIWDCVSQRKTTEIYIYISFQMLSLNGWNYAKVICVWELSDGCHYSLEKN